MPANSLTSSLPDQVRLPFSVAWEIVVQGIRIRLGRSVVTLLGVVLGVRNQVGEEIQLRQSLTAMLGFLTAEIGLLEGKSIVVYQPAALDVMEIRYLEELRKAGAEVVDVSDVSKDSKERNALIVLGSAVPDGVLTQVLPKLRQNVVAFTRVPDVAPERVTVVRLKRPPTQEDLDKLAAEQVKDRVRTIWIMSIATLVTMISISNALLMSVTERFREIGTMKCLGALSSFIRRVFFVESALLGFVGSLAGALFGLIFALLLYAFSYGWVLVFTSLPLAWLLGAFLVCTVGGIAASVIAAIYPAGFASRMVPATALRTNI
jgi:hypothetical protein